MHPHQTLAQHRGTPIAEGVIARIVDRLQHEGKSVYDLVTALDTNRDGDVTRAELCDALPTAGVQILFHNFWGMPRKIAEE